ncbi:MAG: nitroreductase family protein [Treponema sp.]
METLIKLAKSRHSVRQYEQKPVEKEKLDVILEIGRIAPTAGNQQLCKFLVLEDHTSIEKLQKACSSHGAPLVIIVCADKNEAWIRPFDKHSMVEIDASIATDHMMLCAQDLGLSSCWITYFNPDVLRKQFNIPNNVIPVNILAIGYSAESAKSFDRFSQDRKKIETLVHYTTF